jgi:type IV pilus biogenesis/stability protein PilW
MRRPHLAVLLPLVLSIGCISAARQESAGAQVRLGAAFLQEGNAPDAVRALQEAVKLDRRNWNAWNKLGLAYLKQGAPDRAEEAFLRSLELVPENAEVNNNYGYMLVRMGRHEEALPRFEAAMNDLTYRKPSLVLSNWGHALYMLDRHEEAEQKLDQAIARAPNLCQAHFNRGLVREARDDKARALDDFEAVIQMCGESAAGAYYRAGMVLLELDDKRGACTYLRTAAEDGARTDLGDAAADLHAREC